MMLKEPLKCVSCDCGRIARTKGSHRSYHKVADVGSERGHHGTTRMKHKRQCPCEVRGSCVHSPAPGTHRLPSKQQSLTATPDLNRIWHTKKNATNAKAVNIQNVGNNHHFCLRSNQKRRSLPGIYSNKECMIRVQHAKEVLVAITTLITFQSKTAAPTLVCYQDFGPLKNA